MISAALLLQAFSAVAGDFVKINDIRSFSENLAARTSAMTSIRADVVQKKYLSVFNSEVVSK